MVVFLQQAAGRGQRSTVAWAPARAPSRAPLRNGGARGRGPAHLTPMRGHGWGLVQISLLAIGLALQAGAQPYTLIVAARPPARPRCILRSAVSRSPVITLAHLSPLTPAIGTSVLAAGHQSAQSRTLNASLARSQSPKSGTAHIVAIGAATLSPGATVLRVLIVSAAPWLYSHTAARPTPHVMLALARLLRMPRGHQAERRRCYLERGSRRRLQCDSGHCVRPRTWAMRQCRFGSRGVTARDHKRARE